jgi:transposase
VAVEKDYGIPVAHSIYQANAHDSTIFPEAISRISKHLSEFNQQVTDYTVILKAGISSNFVRSIIGQIQKSEYSPLFG